MMFGNADNTGVIRVALKYYKYASYGGLMRFVRFGNEGQFCKLGLRSVCYPTRDFGAVVSPSSRGWKVDHAVSLSSRRGEMEVVTSKD